MPQSHGNAILSHVLENYKICFKKGVGENWRRELEVSFVSLLCITKLTFATGDSSVVVSRDLAKVATRVRIPAFAWEGENPLIID